MEASNRLTVLHVGCGREQVHSLFRDGRWRELRLDIDATVAPDIVASLTDMQTVADMSMDAVYSSHNLEHLYAHEVPVGLREFLRVLKPTGFALIGVPDLQAAAELIVADKLTEPAYLSPAGPVTPIDMLYGFRSFLAAGNHFMAHHTGFTAKSLIEEIIGAGFAWVKVAKDDGLNLWAKAYKTHPNEETASAPLW